jgi:putative ABC transport system permease protein
MPLYLALKETWRNRSRFMLFSLVIALITTLVLFVAALAGGLATANRQFIERLDADLLVYQENSDLSAASSRLGVSEVKQVRRVEGVAGAGPIGFSSATVVLPGGQEQVDVALVGVEPGEPGNPLLLAGTGLRNRRGNDVIIDDKLAEQAQVGVGDTLIIRTTQGSDEETYDLRVVGLTNERQYFFQPSIIVPLATWDKIRPQALASEDGEIIANVVAVQLSDPTAKETMSERIAASVDSVEVADKPASILAIPGYTAQQSTLNTVQGFTLFIGILVVGGFFQIQTLQKVPQIGMLKAIGTSNGTVAITTLMQIVAVTVVGVLIGSLGTLLLSLGLPAGIPILFSGPAIGFAIATMLLIGPLGGLVSIRLASRIEPLTAIGLGK